MTGNWLRRPISALYILLAIALALGCWSFVQSERYRRATDLTLSQTYEIQWRSTQIRERMVRTAGYLRLASKTGEIDPALERDMMLVGINVEQLLALEYVGRFLKAKDIEFLEDVRDIMEDKVAPIVASAQGFDEALRYMETVEQHMFEVSGAAVAHSLTMNQTAQIAIAATQNSFVFAVALTLVVVALMIITQRAEFAKRRDQHIRSFASLYAHMTQSRVSALQLFLGYLDEASVKHPEMLAAARGAVQELEAITIGLSTIAYAQRDTRRERLSTILGSIAVPPLIKLDLCVDLDAAEATVPATQMRLVIEELVRNAEAALCGRADGQIKIIGHVKFLPIRRRRDLLVEIVDNGPGMSREVLKKAQIPFFSTKAGSHTGLGLTGCVQMVTALTGRFTITSAPGCGTTVQVSVPLGPAASDRQ
jgi:signal transduction histidine kinase